MFGFKKKEEAAESGMYLIAGLGNPGAKYEHTRHNAGFDALDVLIERYDIPGNGRKFSGMFGKATVDGHKVIAVKPLTYMNNSGECIAPLAKYFKIPADHVIVLYDDIELDPGFIRVRAKGSAGGHNGMKSIIKCLGTQEFPRVRIGVGKKPPEGDLVAHVLGRFSKDDQSKVNEAMEHAVEAVKLIMDGAMDEAMNRYNRKSGNES